MPKSDNEQRLAAYERLSEWPLLFLALAMIPLLTATLAFDLSAAAERAIVLADLAIWAIFAADLALRAYLATDRTHYLARHWLDVLIVVLPFLRPLRALRAFRALRALRVLAFFARSGATTRSILRRHGLDYLVVLIGLLVVGSALTVAVAEESGGPIDDFPTALWWAIVTVTTVGYGDVVPDSALGRSIGVVLMLAGIGLFSAMTANVAAYFARTEQEVTNRELLEELRALRARLDATTDAAAR